jgi:hypothetical protein
MSAITDDDGIIDLHALSTPKGAAVVASVFPTAFTVDAEPEKKPRSAARIIVAIAASLVVLVLAGVGLRYAFRGAEPVPQAALAMKPPVLVTTPPPPPAPVATPDPAPTTASTDDASPAPKKKSIVRRSFSAAQPKSTVVASRPAPAVKPADPCGCHGNFDCNLRCAAGAK